MWENMIFGLSCHNLLLRCCNNLITDSPTYTFAFTVYLQYIFWATYLASYSHTVDQVVLWTQKSDLVIPLIESSDIFPFSLQIQAKLLTMAGNVLRYQDSCTFSVLYFSLLILASWLFFEQARMFMAFFMGFLIVSTTCCLDTHMMPLPLYHLLQHLIHLTCPLYSLWHCLFPPTSRNYSLGSWTLHPSGITHTCLIIHFWSLSWAAPPLSPLSLSGVHFQSPVVLVTCYFLEQYYPLWGFYFKNVLILIPGSLTYSV